MCGFSSSEQSQNQFSPICRSLTVLFLLDQLIVLLFYVSLLICGGFSPIMFCAAAPCSCVLWHVHLHSSISTPSHIITLLFITGCSKQKKLKVSLLFFFTVFIIYLFYIQILILISSLPVSVQHRPHGSRWRSFWIQAAAESLEVNSVFNLPAESCRTHAQIQDVGPERFWVSHSTI